MSLSWMFCGYKAHLVIELIYAYCYGAYFKAHRQGTHAVMEWFNPHSKPTGLQECSEISREGMGSQIFSERSGNFLQWN